MKVIKPQGRDKEKKKGPEETTKMAISKYLSIILV